ncbi:MAG: RHS repeat-associated core domain-containing protein [Chloroflexi bacterium]|nr:RHS repeat-associated core domain-containing protein [Chloroflexota bacterium]
MYDYRARFYDPTLGRFLQPDPLVPEPGNPQALNRYAYVYNNPLRYVDGGGHLPVVPLLVAGAIIALKIIDYGWTAWDAYQSLRVLNDPNALEAARAEAAANLALIAVTEAAEPDDLLPVALPLDDLARKGILKAGREIGEQATRQAVEEVASAAIRKPPIVIGENMERVRRYAQKIGAETIDDWLGGRKWTPELNDEFINTVKREGREVVDIGPDFNRRLRYRLDPTDHLGRPPSIVYGRERRQLSGYPNYRRVYERFWKYGGGVPGLDY